MRDELKEVIRVLQLVHYDVHGWEPISVSELKRLKEYGFLVFFFLKFSSKLCEVFFYYLGFKIVQIAIKPCFSRESHLIYRQ